MRVRLSLAISWVALHTACGTITDFHTIHRRPLTVPSGATQFVASIENADIDALAFDESITRDGLRVAARVGLTDTLELRAPATLAMRFGDLEGLQLSVGAGIGGLRWSTLQARANDDPRELAQTDSAWVVSPAVSVTAKRQFGDSLSLAFNASFRRSYAHEGFEDVNRATAGLAASIPLRPWVTLVLPMSVSIVEPDSTEGGTFLKLGGVATEGFGALGTLVLHLGDQFDVGLAYGRVLGTRKRSGS
ncbi:MAG: hypothetical protein AAF658_06925, partial [Myxococcota bacterium]